MADVAVVKNENAACVKFDDSAIDKFLSSRLVSKNTAKTYNNSLSRLFNFFSAKKITMPTEESIYSFLQNLKEEKKTDSTIKLYMTVAKSFFKFTARKGIYPDITADVQFKIKKATTHKKKALTTAQAKNLLAACVGDDVISLRNRAIIALCLQCGLRTCEVSRLDVEDLSEGNGFFFLAVQGKGSREKDQQVKVSPRVAQMIYAYLEKRSAVFDSAPMFISQSHNVAWKKNSYGVRLSEQSVQKIIKARMTDAGIKDKKITPHSTRHFCATQAIKSGIDIREVAEMLRHASVVVTAVYLHDISIESRRAELAVADALFSA